MRILVQEHAPHLLMQLHEDRDLTRRHDDFDGVVGAAERQRRHARRLAELSGIVLDGVMAGAPVGHDASSFVGERWLRREALAATRVGQPDSGDRNVLRCSDIARNAQGYREGRRQSVGYVLRASRLSAHRPNSVPSASTMDHMYISDRPVALGLPMHVTRSPALMRSKSQPRRNNRLTLLNSISQLSGGAVVVCDAQLHHGVRVAHLDELDLAADREVRHREVERGRRVMRHALWRRHEASTPMPGRPKPFYA